MNSRETIQNPIIISFIMLLNDTNAINMNVGIFRNSSLKQISREIILQIIPTKHNTNEVIDTTRFIIPT